MVWVFFDALLIGANDFHVGANHPGLGTQHVHLLTRVAGNVEDRRIPGSLGTRRVDTVCGWVTG